MEKLHLHIRDEYKGRAKLNHLFWTKQLKSLAMIEISDSTDLIFLLFSS